MNLNTGAGIWPAILCGGSKSMHTTCLFTLLNSTVSTYEAVYLFHDKC
jgi:hypothetical protein